MLYLKKYFTEGLIQMAILLSLGGVRVDVGLEPYLPASWHEMILGPTSALTQTQFHNLRNRLEEGHSLHPKSVDLDGFFTARRLLGWVRSLDRLQVPHPELQTWLVQREPDALPVGCSDPSSLLERAAAGVERDRTAPPMEARAELSNLEEEDEEEDKETSASLQECLRLLEETFPFTEEEQLSDVDDRGESQPSHRERQLSPIIPTDNPSLDLELDWQDLLSIMDPENIDENMTTSFEDTLDARPAGTFQGVGSEAPAQNSNNLRHAATEANQALLFMGASLQHGVLGPRNQAEIEPALLPLTPSAELDDQRSAMNTRHALENPQMDPLYSPPDHMDLLAEDPSEDPSEDFDMTLNAEDNSSTFNMNLLTQDVVDRLEPENLPDFDVNFNSYDLTPSSFSPSLEGNDMTQDLLVSPSSVFRVDEEDGEHEDGLSDLLEDATILDEIRLLDLALEEGFSPEMVAKLEEEGYLDREIAQQETGRDDDHSGSDMVVTDEQPGRHQQDGEGEADSDSGLSLDFSHSPASPCASEASSYSSSSSSCSSSSSSSSPSCVSAVGSLFSEDEDEDAEEDLVGSAMEVEVTIKQEEVEEEEMGAVGGGYPSDVKKLFPSNYEDHKLFNGFSWLENIGHDHTYNQPWSSDSSPYLGKMPAKPTKSVPHHDNVKPYHRSSSRHISMTKMWSRDERRAQALKIPFSNELIVNLPVEEFNDLLTHYQLDEDQLTLIRDIRRRGKNKIAAQNCRKRKQDVVLGLENNVSGLRRHRSRLLREKQEALRNLQEMKRRLGMLYQEVFSRLRDEEGRPLDATEYLLHFGPSNTVTVASRQQVAEKPSKKQRDKKK